MDTLDRADLVRHLVEGRIAGAVATPRENNLLHYRLMADRDPHYLLGLDPSAQWSAQSVLELRNPIRVEGHTDSRPISTPHFPSNYELSSARALSVVHYLRSHGVPGRRLQGVAFGEFRPRGDNATEAGRAENRRIEVLVLRTNGSPGATPADALGG